MKKIIFISLLGLFLLACNNSNNVQKMTEYKQSDLYKKRNVLGNYSMDTLSLISDWENFYKYQYGRVVNFSKVPIPPRPENGFWRLVFIPKNITLNQQFNQWDFNKKSKYTDLDKTVYLNTRNTDENYTIWVREEIQSDFDLRGKSVRETDLDQILGITLLERMVLESKHYQETGNHLDIYSSTLCSGSRFLDGSVPVVSLSENGSVYIGKYDLNDKHTNSAIRRVVAL